MQRCRPESTVSTLKIQVNERIHIAGQIPLIPPTLLLPSKPATSRSTSRSELVCRNVQLQATLAMQHVRKIITVLRSPSQTGGGWEGWAEGCVAWWALPPPSSSARNDAMLAKRGVHEVEIVGEAIRIWADQVRPLFRADATPFKSPHRRMMYRSR